MDSPRLTTEQIKEVAIFSGSCNIELAQEVVSGLGVELGKIELKTFPNGERYVRYEESVREKRLYLIQSLASTAIGSINDYNVEFKQMIRAARGASANKINAFPIPFAYARHDKKDRGRETNAAADEIVQYEEAGADRLMTIDIHSEQTQGAARKPMDLLTSRPIFIPILREKIAEDPNNSIFVSPDIGRIKTSAKYASRLGNIAFTMIAKERLLEDPSQTIFPDRIDGVGGKNCYMVDDMIDTAGTIIGASEVLKRSGAKTITVLATHGYFSNNAAEKLKQAPIDNIYTTNTIPQDDFKKILGDHLHVASVGPLLAEAIYTYENHGSISALRREQ